MKILSAESAESEHWIDRRSRLVRSGSCALNEALLQVVGETNTYIVENDGVRITSRADAYRFWRRWWMQELKDR